MRTQPGPFALSGRQVAVLCVALVAVCASCAAPSSANRRDDGAGARHVAGDTAGAPVVAAGAVVPPTTNPANVSVTYPATLPDGYDTLGGISSDQSGGVWAFAQGSASASSKLSYNEGLLHWKEDGSLVSTVSVTQLGDLARVGMDSPVLVDGAGHTWVGLNTSLVELTDGGVLATVPLGQVASTAGESSLPQPPSQRTAASTSVQDVESLALGPGGQIVVGRRYSAELEIVDPTSHAITRLSLPAGSVLSGLGNDLAGNGALLAASLYVGNGEYRLAYFRGDFVWTVSDGSFPCPAYGVNMSGDALAIDGSGCAGRITVSASGNLLPQLIKPAGPSITANSAVGVCSMGGDMYLLSTGGSAVYLESDGGNSHVSLGSINVGLSSANGAAASQQATTQPVALGQTCSSNAADGSVWFVPAQGGNHLGLIRR